MALKYIQLPLFNDTYYSYSINLEGNTYVLEFLYVERAKTWIFYLKDSEQNVLISGQRLTPNTLLFNNYKIDNLTGGFYYTPTSDETDPDNMQSNVEQPKDFFRFFYIYDDGE